MTLHQPQPERMRGVQLTGHGGPEKLVWNAAIPLPCPGPGDVLVKVLAAGVNNTDINTRIGWYAPEIRGATGSADEDADIAAGGWSGALNFPLIQGGDLCGRVVANGAGATMPLGARVICPTNQPEPADDAPTRFRAIGSEYDGAFAEYCCVPARHLHDVSASPLSDTELAALPCAFGTAFNLLTRAGVGAGEAVLITGASGGVGLAAVQLAAHMGAHVTGIASPQKQAAVREAGAVSVLDRGATPPGDAFDVVIDLVAGPGWADLIGALKPGGRYAVSGAIAGPIVEMDLRAVYLRDITILGCTYTPPETFAALVDLVNAGQIKPLISKTYPLQDIAVAQADFQAKRYPGKLVLIPPESHP